MGHSTRVGHETPGVSVAALGDRIYSLHVKDAIYDTAHPQSMADGWRYVAPGTGQLPIAKAIALLRTKGYDGWLIFEHEKRWHAELLEPEEMFPKFVDWYRGL
jgi:sugar phosphate isomerase/epimerase